MLWWNSTKETQEIEKELPEDLKEFFKDNNPDKTQNHKYEVSPHQKQVNKVLSKVSGTYNYEFDLYKKKNTIRNVSIINCAELQLKVIECFKSLSFTSIDNCSKPIKTNKSCMDIQSRALERLFYNDCYSIEHCDKIRYIIDHLFTKNFGQFGEEINDDTLNKFNKDLDANFYKVWK